MNTQVVWWLCIVLCIPAVVMQHTTSYKSCTAEFAFYGGSCSFADEPCVGYQCLVGGMRSIPYDWSTLVSPSSSITYYLAYFLIYLQETLNGTLTNCCEVQSSELLLSFLYGIASECAFTVWEGAKRERGRGGGGREGDDVI